MDVNKNQQAIKPSKLVWFLPKIEYIIPDIKSVQGFAMKHSTRDMNTSTDLSRVGQLFDSFFFFVGFSFFHHSKQKKNHIRPANNVVCYYVWCESWDWINFPTHIYQVIIISLLASLISHWVLSKTINSRANPCMQIHLN